MLAIEEFGKQWLLFNAREDLLHGLVVGATVEVARAGGRETAPAVVTELLPLGPFATWQAERAVGDHDRNTLRLRLDPGESRLCLRGKTLSDSRPIKVLRVRHNTPTVANLNLRQDVLRERVGVG